MRQHYEQELAVTVGTGTERWLAELRLAIVGIILSVGLGAADIALSLSTWEVALVVGVASTLVFTAVLWRLRPRPRAGGASLDRELDSLDAEIAGLRAAVDAEPSPLGVMLDAWAEALDEMAEHADRIAEEAYLTTDSGSALRRLRDYDRDLSELTAVIRCRRKSA